MYKCAEHIGCIGNHITIYSEDANLKFEKCNECGIFWRSLDSIHISKPYEQSYFDSKNYEKKRKHKVNKSGWLIDLARSFHPNLSSVLEIGCSIGYTLEAAKNRGINHLGIDISNYAVDFCKNIGLNAGNFSFEDLRKEKNKYDLIFMQHVLEHFEDPFNTLNDCRELLDENGLLLIMVPNSNYQRAENKREKHRFYSMDGVGSEHYVYFNYTNISKVLEVSGFKVIQKNYPVSISNFDSFSFFINRILRRSLSTFNIDQELLVIAQKI